MALKTASLGIILFFVCSAAFAQFEKQHTLASREAAKPHIVNLPVAELGVSELYDKYLKGYKKAFRCSYFVLDNLSKAAFAIQQSSAFDCLDSHMAVMENSTHQNLDTILNSASPILLDNNHSSIDYSRWN